MHLKNNKFLTKIKNKIKATIKLNTHQIIGIGILLALTTLVSLLQFPLLLPFLKIDFGNTINLIAILIIGLPYSLLIAMIAPWLRLSISSSSNPIGELAYMISTITLLLLYCSLHMLFKLPYWKVPTAWRKRCLLVELPTVIITFILQSLLNTFFNWAFILDLYDASYFIKNQIWIVILPFNLIKFSLVLGLYLVLLRPVNVLLKNLNWLSH